MESAFSRSVYAIQPLTQLLADTLSAAPTATPAWFGRRELGACRSIEMYECRQTLMRLR